MYHLVARARAGTLLFRDAREANALWRILTSAFPELIALCLMPDHIHLILPDPPGKRLGRAMSAYAQWRNQHRGESGAVWTPHPEPEHIPDEKHLRRTVRYVLLNPCRAGLVDDPLSWPWSTHRDRVGFAFPRVGPAEADPHRFHHYISGDPSVSLDGTELPHTQHRPFRWEDIADAACATFRVGPEALSSRHPARPIAVQAAWIHGVQDRALLQRETGLHRTRIHVLVRHLPQRGALLADPALAACVAVVGDSRFAALPWLPGLRGWGRYAGRAGGFEVNKSWSGPRRGEHSGMWRGGSLAKEGFRP